MLLALHATLFAPCFAALAVVPVVDVAAVAAAAEIGPLEAVGAGVVDSAAGGDGTAPGEDAGDVETEEEGRGCEMHG